MGSIKTLLLHSHAKLHRRNEALDCSLNLACTSSTIRTRNPRGVPTLHISSSKHVFHTLIPSKMTGNLSPSFKFSNFMLEKLVGFVVGSFVVIGCFGVRPSLAAIHNTSINLEERRGTHDNDQSEEERMFERLLEKEPRNVDALTVILYGKMRRGKNKEAMKYVERLIDIQPNEVEWKLLQALCYELTGQLNKAKKLFEEILVKRPVFLRALHGLAMVMQKKGEGPLVFEMLDKALDVARVEEKVTEERNIRILIVQMHIVQGQLEEGLSKLQELVNENPRDFRPYLSQGIIYTLQNKKREAAEKFEIYTALVPDEFPQREFLDEVVLAAKTKPLEELKKEFEAQISKKA